MQHMQVGQSISKCSFFLSGHLIEFSSLNINVSIWSSKVIVFLTLTITLPNLVPRCFLGLCFAVDAFDERAIFLKDFFFEVGERLSQIIDATLPSGMTGEAVVAVGVTISVVFFTS